MPSCLGSMAQRPYAFGERPSGYNVPSLPLLSGNAAWHSLTGHGHTAADRARVGADQFKQWPKQANLRALAGAAQRGTLEKLAADPERMLRDYPTVAGFLLACGQARMSEQQIAVALTKAAAVDEEFRRFTKYAFGGYAMSKENLEAAHTPPPEVVQADTGLDGSTLGDMLSNSRRTVTGGAGALGGGLGTVVTGLGAGGAHTYNGASRLSSFLGNKINGWFGGDPEYWRPATIPEHITDSLDKSFFDTAEFTRESGKDFAKSVGAYGLSETGSQHLPDGRVITPSMRSQGPRVHERMIQDSGLGEGGARGARFARNAGEMAFGTLGLKWLPGGMGTATAVAPTALLAQQYLDQIQSQENHAITHPQPPPAVAAKPQPKSGVGQALASHWPYLAGGGALGLAGLYALWSNRRKKKQEAEAAAKARRQRIATLQAAMPKTAAAPAAPQAPAAPGGAPTPSPANMAVGHAQASAQGLTPSPGTIPGGTAGVAPQGAGGAQPTQVAPKQPQGAAAVPPPPTQGYRDSATHVTLPTSNNMVRRETPSSGPVADDFLPPDQQAPEMPADVAARTGTLREQQEANGSATPAQPGGFGAAWDQLAGDAGAKAKGVLGGLGALAAKVLPGGQPEGQPGAAKPTQPPTTQAVSGGQNPGQTGQSAPPGNDPAAKPDPKKLDAMAGATRPDDPHAPQVAQTGFQTHLESTGMKPQEAQAHLAASDSGDPQAQARNQEGFLAQQKHNPNDPGWVDKALEGFAGMPGWQQGLFGLGLGGGLIGLITGLMGMGSDEGGGGLGMLMGILGLGTAGVLGANSGMFGQGAQQGIQGLMKTIGLDGQTGAPPATAAAPKAKPGVLPKALQARLGDARQQYQARTTVGNPFSSGGLERLKGAIGRNFAPDQVQQEIIKTLRQNIADELGPGVQLDPATEAEFARQVMQKGAHALYTQARGGLVAA